MNNVKAIILLLFAMLLVAGCSGNSTTFEEKESDNKTEVKEDHAKEEDDHDHEEEEDSHEEVDGTRLAIGYDGGVIIADSNFAILDTMETGTSALALAADHRHAFLNNREEGVLKLLDLGVWTEDHGDHGHTNAEEPVLSTYSINGLEPTHITGHGSKTAIFYDGDGSTEIYTNVSLKTETKPTPLLTIPGIEHHGVAVPLTNGSYAVSYTDEHDPQTLPEGIIIYDKEGKELSRFDSCPGLHGEASSGSKEDEIVAFGCEGQVFLYTSHDNEGLELTLPDEGARVGTIKSHDGSLYMLGNYSSKENPELNTNVTIINTVDKSLKKMDIGTQYTSSMAVSRTGDGYVLGIDGVLYQIDLEKGEIKSEVKVVDAFELVEGHGHGTVYPTIALMDDRILVTDPIDNKILLVNGDKVETVLTIEVQPTSILAVSAN
ncbi:hypothetical protein FZC76_13885 [Sutcliffiella horikoshii]|uniref:Uncharacterized protein n=1 Tax=Sutcliffiella horikoshii TaxID=79883 RepID=A0A5D4SWA8_9BACI|nr:hypothetical protein [Sutcliffiella horikoshii]TYS67660.1 hypothetical protein FZC76_13885 [Sutcliffiella horikoshii]